MNLFELLFFLFCFGVGVCFGAAMGHRFGWPGYPLGFLVGAFGCGAVLCGLFNALAYLEQMAYRGRPPYPVCRNGKCQWPDYRPQKDRDQIVSVCQCGGRYRKDGRHVYEVLPDGSSKPYMIWRPFRGWYPEDTS